MTHYKTYLHHFASGSNHTHHHYYTASPPQHSTTTPGLPNDPDHAQRKYTRALRRATTTRSIASSEASTSASAPPAVIVEERAPRVYEHRGAQLVRPASMLRHASVPRWFLCAGRAGRWGEAAWEADWSMKVELGYEEAGRRERVRRERKAAVYERVEYGRCCERCEEGRGASSVFSLDDWLQWQKREVQRRAVVKSNLGKTLDWERSETRQWAEFEEWQKKNKGKSQQKECVRLRGKEKAFVRNSTAKRVTGLPSLRHTRKTRKTGRCEVNDVEWVDVPTYYQDRGDLRWERRVRLL